jgi:hypothetical protein
MSESPKYKDPIWQDKANRYIVCRILQGNGEYAVCHINAAGGENEDYDAVLEMYGEEEIDRLTAEHDEERKRQDQIRKERAEADLVRKKQEILFNMKLEAFEVDEIKSSDNRELKKRLRKAKTPIEVHAYATLLIQEALVNAE